MKFKLSTALAVAFCAIASSEGAWAQGGQLSEYYIDWADVRQGATISSPCKADPDSSDLESLIKYPRGSFAFADGVEQREEFTIDLGQERMLGQIIFRMGGGRDRVGETKASDSFAVSVSTKSKDGPWTPVYKLDPAFVTQSFALENVPARWVRFAMADNNGGAGSRVGKVKVYKRYQLKTGPEIIKEFHKQFRRDADGLGDFWKAVDAARWEEACDLLIEHFSHWPPEGKGEASPRVAAWMRNEIDEGGCVYKYDSTNWDWFRRKPDCPQPTLGGPPGGFTILHLLKSAWAATGDEAYARQLAELLKDYLQDVPCPRVHRGQDGSVVAGWAGIVASQRTWSFGIMVHTMFQEKKYFDRDLKINLLFSLWEHIEYMRAILPELGGNWLTNANTCLFTAAVDYPEFVNYKDWLEGSRSFFETSLARDFYPSGKASEDSTMYTPIASNQLTGQYATMKKAGVTVNEDTRQRMAKLWDCFAVVHYPDLSVPAIGDAHRESPLTLNAHAIPPNYLEMFDRPDFVYINSQGKHGTTPEQTSRAFSDCGWYIMRGPWETKPYKDARQLLFKASKGQGHGHRDQLAVTVYAYGREIITDPGQPAYGQMIERQVRPTWAHSTICVDGEEQGGCPGVEHAWVAQPGMDFVDAEVAPYKGLVHRRQIVFLKSGKKAPDYWLIHDSMTGEGEHKYDLNYNLNAGANPQVVDGSVCTTWAERGNALIRCLDQSAKPEIVDSSIARVYELVPSKLCRFTKQQGVPVKFDTLILPFKGAKAPTVKTEYLQPDPECAGADVTCVRVTTDSGQDTIVISGKAGTALSFESGKIRTDAAVAVIRTDRKGKVIYASDGKGTKTTYNGKTIGGK